MGYRVKDAVDVMRDAYGPREGLEGPFKYPNGRVLYYSPKDGEYWDPATDWFVPNDEVADLQQSIFNIIRR